MTNEMQVFENPEFGSVRTTSINGEPWFVGRDVAVVLGYSNSRDALAKHIDDEDKGVAKCDTLKGKQEMVIINESGLYSLILSSKLDSAKRFKRWVTSEVLPAIRKQGHYTVVTAAPVPTLETRILTTDDFLRAAGIIATCKDSRLVYVLGFLQQAGIELPYNVKALENVSADTPIQAVHLLQRLHTEYGLSNTQIGKIIGLDRVQAARYSSGRGRPAPQRAALIVRQCEKAIADLEEQTVNT